MIFQESKKESGWYYKVDEIFGTLEIDSPTQLGVNILDGMVSLLLRENLSAETITGEVKHENGIVKYTFNRAPIWDDDEKTPCENIPTSTREQASESIPLSPWNFLKKKEIIFNWCKRFAEAFLEAWRKTK